MPSPLHRPFKSGRRHSYSISPDSIQALLHQIRNTPPPHAKHIRRHPGRSAAKHISKGVGAKHLISKVVGAKHFISKVLGALHLEVTCRSSGAIMDYVSNVSTLPRSYTNIVAIWITQKCKTFTGLHTMLSNQHVLQPSYCAIVNRARVFGMRCKSMLLLICSGVHKIEDKQIFHMILLLGLYDVGIVIYFKHATIVLRCHLRCRKKSAQKYFSK